MGSASLTHWLVVLSVVLSVVLIVFGAGRLPKAMGEFARGIGAFRSGLRLIGMIQPDTAHDAGRHAGRRRHRANGRGAGRDAACRAQPVTRSPP